MKGDFNLVVRQPMIGVKVKITIGLCIPHGRQRWKPPLDLRPYPLLIRDAHSRPLRYRTLYKLSRHQQKRRVQKSSTVEKIRGQVKLLGCFALFKCKVLLQKWISSNSNRVLAEKDLGCISSEGVVHRVNCLRLCRRLDWLSSA